jgi:hypothetical protein
VQEDQVEVVVTEAVVADAVVEVVAEVVAKLAKKNQRKNLSSILANTKTKKSALSSAAVEKVSAVNANFSNEI